MTGAHAGITVSKFANELELQHTADMDVHAFGGIDNLALVAIEDVVNDIGTLLCNQGMAVLSKLY